MILSFVYVYDGHGRILILSKAVVWSGKSLAQGCPIVATANFIFFNINFSIFLVLFLHGLKSWMVENAFEQLGPSQSIC
jgi:hypothetical protein